MAIQLFKLVQDGFEQDCILQCDNCGFVWYHAQDILDDEPPCCAKPDLNIKWLE